MKFPKLEEAQGRLDALRKEVADVLAESGPEYDATKIKSQVFADGHALAEWLRGKNAEMDDAKAAVTDLQAIAEAAGGGRGADSGKESGSAQDDDSPGPRARQTIGRAFVESDAFKGYRRGSGAGPVGKLDYRVIMNTLFSTTAGWDPEDTRTGRVEFLPTRPAPRVVDAIPQAPTNQSAVKYMEETTFTPAAAETAEGGTYPEAVFVLTERSQVVEKVAVWLPVTDEQFEDEEEAEAYVNNRLPFALRQRVDLQVLVGNGTTPNLLGTENKVGIQTQALGTDPIFDAAYKLFRKIRDDGFAEPSVFFIAPSKWETARLARTADGIYILGNPGDVSPVRLWGVPGLETTAVTATKLVAGDYRNFSELRIKRDIDVQVTNAHGTFFIEGKLAIRADVRLAMVHYRPKAFGTVTGL